MEHVCVGGRAQVMWVAGLFVGLVAGLGQAAMVTGRRRVMGE
ncbi:MAG: hypothetical protein R3F65_06020 [bacterium]